ncbi:MFS transporter [Sutterella wadsworthensis]|uniref:MFS transporter n=1 Tax=Sutterella wadsworthensis TaxID=40545 RepID=UPI003A8D95AB
MASVQIPFQGFMMALRSINKQNSPSDGRRAFTFSVAALCVIICFAASAIPVPLIAIWTQALALTTFEVSMTVFAYVGGCLAVLLFFSKRSNYFGRKITVILALAVGIASCLCFIDPHNASALILGRLLQGVFAGLVTSAAMSWTVDTAPKSHVWLGTALSAAGPGIGFIFGTVLSGLSAETGIISGDTLFIGLAVTLAVVLAAAIPAVETMRPGAMSLISALTPSFGIPQKARKVFPLCAVGYIGTWALSTWFQGFSAMIGSAVFADGQPSPAYAALTYMLLVTPFAAGGILCGKLNPRRMLLPLVTGYLVSGTGMFAAAAYARPILFAVLLVLCGFIMGAICSLALKLLMEYADITERAQTISTLYLAGYLGTSIPSFLLGYFVPNAGLGTIGLAFFGWFALVWISAFAFRRLAAQPDGGCTALHPQSAVAME